MGKGTDFGGLSRIMYGVGIPDNKLPTYTFPEPISLNFKFQREEVKKFIERFRERIDKIYETNTALKRELDSIIIELLLRED